MGRRIRVEVTSTVARAADAVFAAISDERESHRWRETRAADYYVGGPCVIGAKLWRTHGRGRRTFEVTACEPYAVYSTAATDAAERETLSLRPVDPLTTEVLRILERETSAWLPALARWRERRRLRRECDALRQWIELTEP